MEYRGYDFVGGLRLNFICYVSLLMYFMLFVIFFDYIFWWYRIFSFNKLECFLLKEI